MTKYAKFLSDLKDRNFDPSVAQAIENAILGSIKRELQAELASLETDLAQITTINTSNKDISTYKTSLEKKQAAIQAELKTITRNTPNELPIHFAKDFAKGFRNIQYLDRVLLNAPQEIADKKTEIILALLARLNKEELQTQLELLPESSLKDLIENAVQTYDASNPNTPLRNQSQNLAHTAILVLIQKKSKAFEPVNTKTPEENYAAFLNTLTKIIPDVGASTIIDTISESQIVVDPKAKKPQFITVSGLLHAVQQKVGLNLQWNSEAQLDLMLPSRALHQKLRFGQEARREYVTKRERNLESSLFMGRNIAEMEQFTQDGVSDAIFKQVQLEDYVARSLEYILNHKVKAPVHAGIYSTYLGKNSKETTAKHKIFSSDYTLSNYEALFASEGNNPSIYPCPDPLFEINSFGEITVTLNYFSISKNNLKLNGFSPSTRVKELLSKSSEPSSVTQSTYKAADLKDIYTQISEDASISDQAREAFREKIITVIKESGLTPPKLDIRNLGLEVKDELTLRSLLELKQFFDNYQSEDNDTKIARIRRNLTQAFQNLVQCKFKEAIALTNDKVIAQAFEAISKIDEDKIPQASQATYEKSNTIFASSQERKTIALNLKKALETSPEKSDEIKEEKIIEVFAKEYQTPKIIKSLGIPESETADLLSHITTMAHDFVTFSNQTKQGQYPLTEEQQGNYISVLKNISRELESKKIALQDVELKISHKGKITIKGKDGKEIKNNIAAVSLPYSLTKPPGQTDFILSYGGSRGTVAPLPEMEKTRFFTSERILGVGQYGTVKRGDDFLTGEGLVIKEGFVATEQPTFSESTRKDIKYRPLTSRDDPNSGTERSILNAISLAKHATDPNASISTQYWTTPGKPKKLYAADAMPTRYKMVQELAKGSTFKDHTDSYLNKYSKPDLAFHRPDTQNDSLEKMVALSEAIVAKAAEYQTLGFTHNDIKPENFMYFERPDGSYEVEFIDWATGGFKRSYEGKETTLAKVSQEVFGVVLSANDPQGRFVTKIGDTFTYGVNPSLEILHGSRNSTLPYIAPAKVLGTHENGIYAHQSQSANIKDPKLNTSLASNDTSMDDWALTAMTFGICNRKAYLELVKGRAVNDYAIPGILEVDGNGLKVVDTAKFDEFFSPTDDDQLGQDPNAINSATAVMYIPSTYREGEPLHLYRRLEALKKQHPSSASDIDGILNVVRNAISSGEGLNKQKLTKLLQDATICMAKINNQKTSDAQLEKQSLFKQVQTAMTVNNSTATLLSKPTEKAELKNIEILCMYPQSGTEQQFTIEQLNKLDNNWLIEHILSDKASLPKLLIKSIQNNQQDIVITLINKIKASPKLLAKIEQEGLLAYALEQGMTQAAETMLTVLNEPSATNDTLFDVILKTYDSADERLSYLNWNTNALHIAIRNNNAAQLELMLKYLPTLSTKIAPAIHQSLLFSADLLNKELFTTLLNTYNKQYKSEKITTETLLTIFDPANSASAYHLFLQSDSTNDVIPWLEIKDLASKKPELIRSFLLTAPYPLLIAAKNGNALGLTKLFDLISTTKLLSSEKQNELWLQTDEDGKNILNYILEHDNHSALSKIVQNTTPDVLYQLLNNPTPVDPLQNYFKSTASNQDKYSVLTNIFAKIYPDVANEQQQQHALVILLAQREWFVSQGNDVSTQKSLIEFFDKSHLSIPVKLALFAELLGDALATHTPKAINFYKQLEEQLKPSSSEASEERVALKLTVTSQFELHRQRGELSEVLNTLLEEKRSHLETVRAEQLKSEQATSGAKAAEKKLEQQIKMHTEILAGKEQRAQELERQLATVDGEKTSAQEKVAVLEATIAQKDRAFAEQTTESGQRIEALESKHQLEMTDLQQQLSSYQNELNQRNEQSLELEENILFAEEELKQSADDLKQLRSEMAALKADYASSQDNIASLKTEMSELQEKTEKSATEVNSLTEALRANQHDLDQEKSRNEELLALQSQQIGTHQQELTASTARVRELEESNSALTTNLNEAIEKLGEELKALQETYESLKANTEEAERAKTLTESQLIETVDQLKAAQQTLSSQSKTIAGLEGTVLDLERKISEANQQFSASAKEVQRIQSELSEEAVKILSIEKDRDNLQAKLSSLSSDSATQKEAWETSLAEKNKELISLSDQHTAKLTELSEAQHTSKTLEEKVVGLNNQLQAKQQENTELNKRVQELEEKILSVTEELGSSSSSIEILIEALTKNEQEMAAALVSIRSLQNQIADINSQNSTEKSALETQLQEKSRAFESLQSDHISKSEELEAAQQSVLEIQAEIEKLQAFNSQLSIENDQAQQDFSEKLHVASDKLDVAQTQAGVLSTQLQEVQAENAQLKGQIQELENNIGSINLKLMDSLGQTTRVSQLLANNLTELEAVTRERDEFKSQLEGGLNAAGKAALEEKLRKKDVKVRSLQNERDRQLTALNLAYDQKVALNQAIGDLQTEIDILTSDNNRTQLGFDQQLQEAQSKLQKASQYALLLADELTESVASNVQAKEEYESLKTHLDEFESKLNTSNQLIKELQEEITHNHEKLQEIESNRDELIANLVILSEQTSDERIALENQLRITNNAFQKLRDKTTRQEAELTTVTNHNLYLTTDIWKLEETIEALESHQDDLEDELAAAKEMIENLEQQLKHSDTFMELETLARENTALQAELQSLKRQYEKDRTPVNPRDESGYTELEDDSSDYGLEVSLEELSLRSDYSFSPVSEAGKYSETPYGDLFSEDGFEVAFSPLSAPSIPYPQRPFKKGGFEQTPAYTPNYTRQDTTIGFSSPIEMSPKHSHHRHSPSSAFFNHAPAATKSKVPKSTRPHTTVQTPSHTQNMKGSMPGIEANFTGNRELPDVQEDIAIAIKEQLPTSSNYSNEIINNKFVRLADVTDTSQPPQKLLDATVNEVTVYRRFTENNTLSVEQRAAVILKSMGVPPEPGFDFPDELIINGKRASSDFTVSPSGRNKELVEVVHKMFELYDEHKLNHDKSSTFSSGH